MGHHTDPGGGLKVGPLVPVLLLAQPPTATIVHHAFVPGRPLAPLAIALGLMAGIAGSTLRSRALTGAAGLVVASGALVLVRPESLGLLVLALAALLVGAGTVAARLSAWMGSPPPGDPPEVERLRLLHGRTHISCYAGNGPKSCLVDGAGAVSFQVRWRVAVAAGDPLAPGTDRMSAAMAFLALCARRGWVPCFFQTDAELRDLYRGLGLRILKFGEEAVVEVPRFSLASAARADARHEVARARRAGLEANLLREPAATDPFWTEAAAVSNAWLQHRGGHEMGFSLGRLGEVVDTATWCTAVRDGEGRLHAFCSWIRVGDEGLALDLIRRRPGAAAGAVDLCVVRGIEAAQQAGLLRVSLGTVAFRDGLGDAPDGGPARWVRATVYRRGWGGYSYRGLTHFKAKYATRWESRDIALPRGPAAALVLAALARLHLASTPPETAPAVPPLELVGSP